MNSRLINFENNSLVINDGGNKKTVNFLSPIKQIEQFDEVIVVRIHPKLDMFLNENVFGVSYDGKILWQIEKLKYAYKNSPFIGMGREGGFIKLCNWDGTDLVVNPETGGIISKGWSK